jgi:y4mF family transcriptional regulator
MSAGEQAASFVGHISRTGRFPSPTIVISVNIPVREDMQEKAKKSKEPFPYGKIRDVCDIGAAIRTKRNAIGFRQEELAALAGVGPRFLSEIENGKESAEIGKVLRVLLRLGLEVSIKPRGTPDR